MSQTGIVTKYCRRGPWGGAPTRWTVAYAGFSKGGPENLKIMKSKSKIFPLRISPVFGPKLGEDQKKRSSPRFCPFRVLKLSAQVTKRGGACRNFAYYSMLIILSWRPKRGEPWYHAPPKYAPAAGQFLQVCSKNIAILAPF